LTTHVWLLPQYIAASADDNNTCINNLITDLCSHNKVSHLILGDFNYHITWSSDNVEAILIHRVKNSLRLFVKTF